MLTCQKYLFSLPADVSYLNCAYMGPLPKKVEEAGMKGLSAKALPYEILANDFFAPVSKLKGLFSQLVNIQDPERVAIIPSVSYGMANIVQNLKTKPGQNIVMVDGAFPGNYYTWQRLANEKQLNIRLVKASLSGEGKGAYWNEAVLQAIDEQTVAASIPNIHWVDGTRFDLVEVRKKTREVGALMIIDGTQSVGAMPFDVNELQPDALICAAYKWLLGPYSLGLAYYGDYFDGGKPIEESWMNRLQSENFEGLLNYQPNYKPAANRYCVGEYSHFISVPMLAAALEMLLEWKAENIQQYAKSLAAPWLGELEDMGCIFEEESYRTHHLIGLRLPKGMNLDNFRQRAAEKKVFLSSRGDSIRLSVHLFNDEKDFVRLLEVLKEAATAA